LRACDRGAVARGQRGRAPLRVRRPGAVRPLASVLRRLPHAVRRRLPHDERGAGMVIPDLRELRRLTRPSRPPAWPLALGAAIGAALAARGLLAGRTTLPRDAVATVNGVAIRAADYERAGADVGADRRCRPPGSWTTSGRRRPARRSS